MNPFAVALTILAIAAPLIVAAFAVVLYNPRRAQAALTLDMDDEQDADNPEQD